MRWYKADLHIHTVLSPCGGLDMSPVNIIKQAADKHIDMIAITDHNSMKHCEPAQKIGRQYGINVIAGVELNTKEEIHCLAFFENSDDVNDFQKYIDDNLPVILNKPGSFGHQFVVDENENILGEEERLLLVALNAGIDEIEKQVHKRKGIFIPAHVNRSQNGIFNQLGFIPANLKTDALEISSSAGTFSFSEQHPETNQYMLIANSDAHTIGQIGSHTTEYFLEKPLFSEIKAMLESNDKQKIRIV